MSLRILLIEDEPVIADFVVRGLTEEGFAVDHAADGLTGWRRLITESWDVLLLDWSLPGLDGLDVLRRHREAGGMTPVLFLTAHDAVSDRVIGLEAGADDYLCKPFAFEELLARVRALTRRADRGPGAVLTAGDVTADLAARRAERAGHRLSLTQLEFNLLALFLRHPGEVLSRSRIYDRVWGERYDGSSNTLEVHVMALRRRLEAHGPRVVWTVRGRGYVFGDEA